MTDRPTTPPLSPAGSNADDTSLDAKLVDVDAEREIDKAVSGRRGIARRYVRSVRRRHPEATPAEIISMLERHYVTAVSAAGMAITVGTIAAEVGISLIPGASGAKAAASEVGKKVAKETAKKVAANSAKAVAKTAALGAARTGAGRVVRLIPAGDKQLQFEITALFALAVADIHGLEYDSEQSSALVYGLTNDRLSQKQIAAMATDLAQSSDTELAVAGSSTKTGRGDLTHWANILADALPGGAAQSLVRGVQTGVLDVVNVELNSKQKTRLEYGVGAAVSGITRFVFGREVVVASHSAFADAPSDFPAHLAVPLKPDETDAEPNAALEALERAAKAVGGSVGAGVAAVGNGVASAAGAASRPFRSVDLDGDGIPDEAQALTAVKEVGHAITGAAGAVGSGVGTGASAVGSGVASVAGSVTRRFRSVDLDGDGIPDEAQAVTAAKGVGHAISGAAGKVGGAFASPFTLKRRGGRTASEPQSDLSPDSATASNEDS